MTTELFYCTESKEIRSLARRAYTENPEKTLKILFYRRWCRGGMGDRAGFREGIYELLCMGETDAVIRNLHRIPEFGYWKDLLVFFGTPIEAEMVAFYTEQLRSDLKNLAAKRDISLAGKWAPTEGKELDRKHNAVEAFCRELQVSKREYRKRYLVPLRRWIKIVETQMCNREWETIDYSIVPRRAKEKYEDTFIKRDGRRYLKYDYDCMHEPLAMTEPRHFVAKYISGRHLDWPSDSDIDAGWESLVKRYNTLMGSVQCLPVIDLPGDPETITNTVATALLLAELYEGPFHNYCYVLADKITLVKIQGTLREKVELLLSMDAGYRKTNLEDLFEHIIFHTDMFLAPLEQFPRTVCIFSDHWNGIKMPRTELRAESILLWVQRNGALPTIKYADGVTKVRGFSETISSFLLEGKPITQETVMEHELQSLKGQGFTGMDCQACTLCKEPKESVKSVPACCFGNWYGNCCTVNACDDCKNNIRLRDCGMTL